jgi:hypothetical protein
MPLHAQRELLAVDLGGLHGAVAGPCGHPQAVGDYVKCLVVVAVHAGLLAEQPAGEGVRLDLHLGPAENGRAGSVLVVGDRVRQVLVQGATEGDVEHLESPADREQWEISVESGLDQDGLVLVAARPGAGGLGMRRGAVRGGVDVTPTGDDQAVEDVED